MCFCQHSPCQQPDASRDNKQVGVIYETGKEKGTSKPESFWNNHNSVRCRPPRGRNAQDSRILKNRKHSLSSNIFHHVFVLQYRKSGRLFMKTEKPEQGILRMFNRITFQKVSKIGFEECARLEMKPTIAGGCRKINMNWSAKSRINAPENSKALLFSTRRSRAFEGTIDDMLQVTEKHGVAAKAGIVPCTCTSETSGQEKRRSAGFSELCRGSVVGQSELRRGRWDIKDKDLIGVEKVLSA
ncbi:hypothetical protein H6P81_000795 [Aristolochia fimbriata]|uniref:Uncharacterized protein n=1 Tax=Aristolochia fimbriata TaxID=158543 RepID=A0AAV7F937_ARIFI|nr:hypothetical protein H6P81_000795 [Aristolochia fimbriata]